MDKDRRDRILDVAIDLAAAGGYENVRQRDVADQAGIALGTLYKSFSSKEHILSAAIEREADELEKRLKSRPPAGETPTERLQALFKIITRAMCHKPKYARAVIRAMASGQPGVASHVTAYQGRMNAIIGSVMRVDEREIDEHQLALATLLQQIWFASLVAWSAGIFSQGDVNSHMSQAIELILASPKTHGLRPIRAE
ncbi:MAG TPA: TetR family transcriptional regulator [Polyangiales bacterium]|nr:TetR family transcriptional regulator [Polyangiales bacterium]